MKQSGSKLQMPKRYEHFALVTLRGRSFPLDPLRYDHATFWHEADARQAEDSMFQIVVDTNGKIVPEDNPEPKERRIILVRYSEDPNPYWSPDIWNSFSGLKFDPISAEEAYDIYRRRENAREDGDREWLPPRLQWERTVSAVA